MIRLIKKPLLRQSLRNYIRMQRRSLTTMQQSTAAQKVIHRVLADARIQSARTIALFLSFDGEIDTRPLIKALWETGKKIYLPVLHPFIFGQLLFSYYSVSTPLIINKLRICEPRLDLTVLQPAAQLDILFTPLVAFDSFGQRIGMGGGFYDRILQHWCPETGFFPIGLAHDCQHIRKALPVEKWDIPLPEIITPADHWRW